MPSIREMHGHIKSIESIGQLTRALQAVSASQVRQATQIADNSLPYSDLAWQVLIDLYHEDEFYQRARAFLEPKEINSALIVFISADRGLAGSFPMNVFREAYNLEKRLNVPVKYITVGKKGREMLMRCKKNIIADFSDLSSATSFHDLKALSRIIVDEFNNENFEWVYLVYTEYTNIAHFGPKTKLLVPLFQSYREFMETTQQQYKRKTGCIFEGDPQLIMNSMVSRIIRMVLFHAVISSKASEHTARMLAMNKATENSEEILADLLLQYNKMRQQTITNDILDIVSGSEGQNRDMEEKRKNYERYS